jgi:hypothetical protein
MYETLTDNLTPLTVTEELRALVARAEAGDQTALPDLRKALDGNPELWRRYGDLGRAAERAWIALTAGDNQMLTESLTRQVELLKDELAGPSGPAPLEKPLIDRVVACWLQVHYADAHYAQTHASHGTPDYLKFAAELQDRANRRYLFAVKQLALVRKLLKPSISFVQIAAHLTSDAKKGTAGTGEAGGRRGVADGGGPSSLSPPLVCLKALFVRRGCPGRSPPWAASC